MAPQGYADGLLKPANQVRAQKNLVKGVPGSNIPQPAKPKRVKQSVQQQMEEARTKLAQQSYLPPGGSVGPVREIQQMKGLSGMHRSIDMDKHMKTREQIMKITEQQDKLHRGRNVADAMREAEELGNQFRHSEQWKQDLSRDQVNKRRHALKALVRENRNPRQEIDDHMFGVPNTRIIPLRHLRAPPPPSSAGSSSAARSGLSVPGARPQSSASTVRGLGARSGVSAITAPARRRRLRPRDTQD